MKAKVKHKRTSKIYNWYKLLEDMVQDSEYDLDYYGKLLTNHNLTFLLKPTLVLGVTVYRTRTGRIRIYHLDDEGTKVFSGRDIYEALDKYCRNILHRKFVKEEERPKFINNYIYMENLEATIHSSYLPIYAPMRYFPDMYFDSEGNELLPDFDYAGNVRVGQMMVKPENIF